MNFLPIDPLIDPSIDLPMLCGTPAPLRRWDIFCQVIDNYGDIGVCWRLAAELAAQGQQVRLHIDDASALRWMAPEGAAGVEVLPYESAYLPDPDVVVEAFGCEAPAAYLAALAAQSGPQRSVLINLEYLSAEDYVERCHRLPSLLMSGPGAGLTRWFFYPGFTPATGGLLRENRLPARQAQFDRQAWRQQLGISDTDLAISLFCYEPPALGQLLDQLAQPRWASPPQLLVTPGRAAAAVQAEPLAEQIAVHWLAPRSQTEFDELLWASDLNLVRGEDSLVRAIWAGQPFVWHIYPQDDLAHHAKLDAFLDWLQAPPSLRAFHHAWNGLRPAAELPVLSPSLLEEWRCAAQLARQRLMAQNGLIAQLHAFAAEKS